MNKNEEDIILFFTKKTYLNGLTAKKLAKIIRKFKIPTNILTQIGNLYQNNNSLTGFTMKLSIQLD